MTAHAAGARAETSPLAARCQGIEVLAFDLDNTLYDEGQYFRAAFAPIAAHLARLCGADPAAVAARLDGVLRAKGRHYHHLFDDVLAELGLDAGAHLGELLAIFRGVRPALTPFTGVPELLDELAGRYRLALITSGTPAVQENKLALLGLRDRFEHVVLSSTLPENKPGQMPFRRLLEAMGTPPAAAAYVGDNPLADFRGPNELGMLTIRVHNPEFDGVAVAAGWDAEVRIEGVRDLRHLFL